MAKPDAFDPTHALDGWRPPAPAPMQDLTLDALMNLGGTRLGESKIRLLEAQPEGLDPTHLLDGWHPPAPAPLDLQLKAPPRVDGAGLDKVKRARLMARGYEMVDL